MSDDYTREDNAHAEWCVRIETMLYALDIVTPTLTKIHRNARGECVDYMSYTRYDADDETETARHIARVNGAQKKRRDI